MGFVYKDKGFALGCVHFAPLGLKRIHFVLRRTRQAESLRPAYGERTDPRTEDTQPQVQNSKQVHHKLLVLPLPLSSALPLRTLLPLLNELESGQCAFCGAVN